MLFKVAIVLAFYYLINQTAIWSPIPPIFNIGEHFIYFKILKMKVTYQKAIDNMFNKSKKNSPSKPSIVGCPDCIKAGTACSKHTKLSWFTFGLSTSKYAILGILYILRISIKKANKWSKWEFLALIYNTHNEVKKDIKNINKDMQMMRLSQGQYIEIKDNNIKINRRDLR